MVDPIMTPIILSRERLWFWTLDTLPAQPGGVTMRRKRSLYPKAHFQEFYKDTGKWQMNHWIEWDEWVQCINKKVTLRPSASCFTYFLQFSFAFPLCQFVLKILRTNQTNSFDQTTWRKKTLNCLLVFVAGWNSLKPLRTLKPIRWVRIHHQFSPPLFPSEYSVPADWTGYKSECQGLFGTWWHLESGRKSLPTFRSRSSVKEVQKLCLDIMKTLGN